MKEMAPGLAAVLASLTVILPVLTLTLTMLVSLIHTENGARVKHRAKNKPRWTFTAS
jgi:preprotein translocase subunit SecG